MTQKLEHRIYQRWKPRTESKSMKSHCRWIANTTSFSPMVGGHKLDGPIQPSSSTTTHHILLILLVLRLSRRQIKIFHSIWPALKVTTFAERCFLLVTIWKTLKHIVLIYTIMGQVIDVWILGSQLCFIWLSVDVLTSTASILHLGTTNSLFFSCDCKL